MNVVNAFVFISMQFAYPYYLNAHNGQKQL